MGGVLISRPGPASSGSPCFRVTSGCNIRVIFQPFVGMRKLSTGRFHRRGISVLSCSTVMFASHGTVSRFFLLYGRLQMRIPRSVGCFYVARAVTLCVRGCGRCHGHGIFFNSAKGVSSLVPCVMGRGARGCLIPLSSIRGSRVDRVLSTGGLVRGRMVVCHAIDGSFGTSRTFSCSVLVFFDPSKVRTLGGGFPSFSRGSVCVNAFNPAATGTIGSTKLHLSLRTPDTRCPSVATTLRSFIGGRGGWGWKIFWDALFLSCVWDGQ